MCTVNCKQVAFHLPVYRGKQRIPDETNDLWLKIWQVTGPESASASETFFPSDGILFWRESCKLVVQTNNQDKKTCAMKYRLKPAFAMKSVSFVLTLLLKNSHTGSQVGADIVSHCLVPSLIWELELCSNIWSAEITWLMTVFFFFYESESSCYHHNWTYEKETANASQTPSLVSTLFMNTKVSNLLCVSSSWSLTS